MLRALSLCVLILAGCAHAPDVVGNEYSATLADAGPADELR